MSNLLEVVKEQQLMWKQAWDLKPKLSLHHAPRRSGKTTMLARLAAENLPNINVLVATCTERSYTYFLDIVKSHEDKHNRITRFNPAEDVDWSQPTLVILDEGTCLPDKYYELLYKPAKNSPNAQIVGLSTSLHPYQTWFSMVLENNDISDKEVTDVLAANVARRKHYEHINYLKECIVQGQKAQEELNKIYQEEGDPEPEFCPVPSYDN